MELFKYYIDDLKIGMYTEKEFHVTEENVRLFSKVSGDLNPLHLDRNYAAKTIFKKRVAHGALIASYISGVLGNDLPGPGAIFVDMNVRFRRPVYLEDIIKCKVAVLEINLRYERLLMEVIATVNNKRVVTGTTTVRLPRRNPNHISDTQPKEMNL